ncbi:unnamed protein product [marine sediment metagenome]|uniref:Uncharacterized protein n=2 Tax=marine sediment metagenome TaxID=412755 RepID=X1LC16_9ZZZZ
MALFHDTIQAPGAVTALVANRVKLGEVELGTGDWIITRAWATVMHAGTITAVMGLAGYIQITSENCAIAPFEFLLEPVSGPLGTGELEAPIPEPRKYVINCPAPAGAILKIYHVADATITTVLSETIVTIEYARASPFPGGQLHMTCGEPAVVGSVSDGGVVSLTDIQIKAQKLLAVVTYVATTTPVASTGHMLMLEMMSDDFGEKGGSQRWGLNPQRAGGVATNSSGQMAKTLLVEIDMMFGKPGQQKVSAEVTAYDAVTTGPLVNWCLIWN